MIQRSDLGSILLLGALIMAPHNAQAQVEIVSPACDMNCPQLEECAVEDLACHDRNAARLPQIQSCMQEQAACMTKLGMYNTYLGQMSLGVALTELPPLYVEVLNPFYPSINLSQWRFGVGDRQPANNATTDCDRTFFNNTDFVSTLRQASISTWQRIDWLLHELRHFAQCREVGGRDFYSRMWWDDLSETDLQGLLQTGNWIAIHDQMGMEQDAASAAQSVWTQLERCCIDPESGELIRPLEVGPIALSATPTAGQPVELSVPTQGGARPFRFTWRRRPPGGNSLESFGTAEGPADADHWTWTPSLPGSYELFVRVEQADGEDTALEDQEQRRTVTVNRAPLAANVMRTPGIADRVTTPNLATPLALPAEPVSLTLDDSSVAGGASVQARVELARPVTSGSLSISNSDPRTATVPSTISVSGSSATFTIRAQNVTTRRVATITVQGNGVSRSAALTVSPNLQPKVTFPALKDVGPVKGRISVGEAPLAVQLALDPLSVRAGSAATLILTLNRPAPAAGVGVTLESEGPIPIELAERVMISAGQRESRVRIATPSMIRNPVEVAIRAFVKGQESPAEAVLRIYP